MEAVKLTEQYLTFKIDHDLFAVDVEKAREILDLVEVSPGCVVAVGSVHLPSRRSCPGTLPVSPGADASRMP